MKKVYLHIGLHKTGTTSIQTFLADKRDKLAELGASYYRGLLNPNNHVDVHLYSLRPDRLTPYKTATGFIHSVDFDNAVKTNVSSFLQEDSDVGVISNEGLSFIRYNDEFDRLASMFAKAHVKIVVYLRNRRDFLVSYRAEMLKHVLPSVIDADSFAYTLDDTWLVNYEARLAGFSSTFGAENVVQINYDDALTKDGSVIPSFLSTIGVHDKFIPEDWNDYMLNKRI